MYNIHSSVYTSVNIYTWLGGVGLDREDEEEKQGQMSYSAPFG